MAKILKSWSGMRKHLEQEMLSPSLYGRVRYSCTKFVGMDGWGAFELYIDNKLIKRFSMETVASDLYNDEKPVDMIKYWKSFWFEKENTPIENRNEYDDVEFSDALKIYRSMNIIDSLNSSNPIVRMFGALDRRTGKRTLIKFKDKLAEQPKWLQEIYELRMTAEGISLIIQQ